jgi:hypothetical protein
MKGRVISPGEDNEREGWFSNYAVEYVVNYEKMRKDGVNLKRVLLEKSDVARQLASKTADPKVKPRKRGFFFFFFVICFERLLLCYESFRLSFLVWLIDMKKRISLECTTSK